MSTAEMVATSEPRNRPVAHALRPQSATARIRLFIADDHSLFRQTLRMGLETTGGFVIVGEASDGREALRAITQSRPDLVLADLGLPLLNGLELADRLRKTRVPARVVVLASRTQEPLLLRMLNPGVSGYLLKEADFDELTLALRKVHSGYSYLTPSLDGRPVDLWMRRWGSQASNTPVDLLTSRERELLQLVGEGYTNREIAEQLCVSVKTVEAHKANICGKLNLRGQAGLVKHAIQAGMIGVGG